MIILRREDKTPNEFTYSLAYENIRFQKILRNHTEKTFNIEMMNDFKIKYELSKRTSKNTLNPFGTLTEQYFTHGPSNQSPGNYFSNEEILDQMQQSQNYESLLDVLLRQWGENDKAQMNFVVSVKAERSFPEVHTKNYLFSVKVHSIFWEQKNATLIFFTDVTEEIELAEYKGRKL